MVFPEVSEQQCQRFFLEVMDLMFRAQELDLRALDFSLSL